MTSPASSIGVRSSAPSAAGPLCENRSTTTYLSRSGSGSSSSGGTSSSAIDVLASSGRVGAPNAKALERLPGRIGRGKDHAALNRHDRYAGLRLLRRVAIEQGHNMAGQWIWTSALLLPGVAESLHRLAVSERAVCQAKRLAADLHSQRISHPGDEGGTSGSTSCSQSRRRLSGCARCSSLRTFSYQRRRYA